MNKLVLHSRVVIFLALAITFCLLLFFNVAQASLAHYTELRAGIDVVIDVRSESDCLNAALPDSACLPVEHLLADNGRLANFSGLFWVLGTLGLNGSEHIAIVGDKSQRRDFVAAVFLIAGQAKIDIVSESMESLLQSSSGTSPGRSRASTRTTIFTAHPRTDLLVLKSELLTLLKSENAPPLLDGRTEGEYWGRTVRASRGGHLPGAIHAADINQFSTGSGQLPIAYAHDSQSGLAYFARIVSQQVNARLYFGGWAEWASDGSLPADAVSFFDPLSVRKTRSAGGSSGSTAISQPAAASGIAAPGFILSGLSLLLLLLVPGAYYLGRARGGAT